MADATTVLPEVQFGFSSTGDPATVFAVALAGVVIGLVLQRARQPRCHFDPRKL